MKQLDDVAKYIFERGMAKLAAFEDCNDEIQYLSLLNNGLCIKLSEEYFVAKQTTGYQVNQVRHKLKILIRNLVG